MRVKGAPTNAPVVRQPKLIGKTSPRGSGNSRDYKKGSLLDPNGYGSFGYEDTGPEGQE